MSLLKIAVEKLPPSQRSEFGNLEISKLDVLYGTERSIMIHELVIVTLLLSRIIYHAYM